MGIAEITPGISGATIAGIFNVYRDFVKVLTAFNKSIFFDFQSFLRKLNFMFLGPLLIGMALAIYSSTFFITYLIDNNLTLFKIFLSIVMLFAVIKNCFFDQELSESTPYLKSFCVGTLIAIAIAISVFNFNFNFVLLIMLAGFLAFSAFILPGISGSLVLVLLGVYDEIIFQIKKLDLVSLAPFLFGMLIAFLIVPKVIDRNFDLNQIKTRVFFSGLIFGSLPAVWLHLV
ncbi:DUF368 domain-containing protein [SAR86 cluster bacterium]|nr:DUF368 domain-containing protein [SAR86 cluster bacterium]